MSRGEYVFGYGSLMEKASRTRTDPESVLAWPARVTGYERGWFHQFAKHVGKSCTFLGAKGPAGATMNGVIYHVGDFEKTKDRETGYTPALLKGDQIQMLDGAGPWDRGQVYIFVSNENCIKEPTRDCPMVQSTAVRLKVEENQLVSIFDEIGVLVDGLKSA